MKYRMLFALLAVVGMALFASPVGAADLPSRKAAPEFVAPPPLLSWTGLYLGLDAGGQFDNPTSINGLGATLNPNTLGFVGGGHLGYNVQIDRFVLGVETDISGIANAATIQGVVQSTPTLATLVNASQSTSWLGTTRLRAGFLIMPSLLVYGTGGVAYGNSAISITAANLLGGVGAAVNQVQVGWAAGGGVEYLILPHWSVKAEYLHYDLGRTVGSLAAGGTFSGGTSENLGRFGVSYHF